MFGTAKLIHLADNVFPNPFLTAASVSHGPIKNMRVVVRVVANDAKVKNQ